ncbi:MAG: fimbria/pilus periplasmic chaperone [Maricaulaceae bacterium]|jgi:P pilus assembly chaperone PapD
MQRRSVFNVIAAGIAAGLGALTLGGAAHAFRVAPMVYDLEPIGSGAATTIRIENTGATPLAVELSAARRTIAPDGTESREPAEADFLLFPPQAVVPPGESQSVRVQYVGQPDIRESRNYVVVVRQLPIDLRGDESAGVQFVFAFATSVTVIPDGARPRLAVASISNEEGPDVSVRLLNQGTAMTRLGEWIWRFENEDGETYSLEGDELRAQIPSPMILPGTERVISVTLPADFAGPGVRALTLDQP